ncbi:MAG: hypothetical protein JNJ57_10275 [Saprospiraceae bacterium]|nr:hypothetical protein [Saprospiraceae bacterium]
MSVPAHQFLYEEFHAFVMLYAANVDGNISAKEETCATSGLSETQCATVKSVFNACDDNQALQVIFSYQDQYWATPEDRDKVISDMVKVFDTDGKHSAMEHVMKHMFERLLSGN